MEMLLAICAGVGLAAASGFRIFIPLLATGLAVRFGQIDPPAGLDWVGSALALIMFAVATLAEVAAYYIPWLDHALDTLTTPGAIGSGILVAAAAMPDTHPAVQWGTAIVAGGGAATTVQLGTVLTRGLSGATTGGIGTPVVSTVEWIIATLLSILAILLPILAALIVVVFLVWSIRKIVQWRTRRHLVQPA